ncbi:PTS galactitol transporter subunit IIC [Eubacterium multiforme]|uniref:PTS system galactitol-specific IIC component n=1 Tax=Eubacterium multiforme TaxID=83339 RepID=A0ABT9UUY8_9FIRM|nr:PTS transporter subunit IIC [Eubacterium multiforme]MDQ0150133.1 PTS system galactitol-specific IIC component [Eubacterium multiforme]
MKAILDYILGLGPAVFLPLIMIILGLCMKMKVKKAITAGLTLGIAFTGMSVILDFMFKSISPAASAFVNNTGIHLNAIDVGWAPMSAIAWAWPYALTVFPIQIVINLVMLAFGWTSTLNVDLWNVWGKILTATIVTAVTGSVPLGLIAASIQVVLELKNADLTAKQINKLTNIPGVTCPHMMTLQCVILAPLNRILDFIPGINNIKLDAKILKKKIGVFGENSVMGFLVGALIAAFAGYDLSKILTVAIQVSTSLVLFPMVAKLFMQALAPIADAVSSFMKNKFKGREFYIGLDWPFMAGLSEVWVAAILLVPIELLLSILLSKAGVNNVLPLGAIINIGMVVPTLIITGGNLFRMLILGTVVTPIYLLCASNFSTMFTELAKQVGTINVPAGQLLSWFGIEAPTFRWSLAEAMNVINGKFIGLLFFGLWILCFVYYAKYMKKRNAKLDEEMSK